MISNPWLTLEYSIVSYLLLQTSFVFLAQEERRRRARKRKKGLMKL
jgi:hypothetical protein